MTSETRLSAKIIFYSQSCSASREIFLIKRIIDAREKPTAEFVLIVKHIVFVIRRSSFEPAEHNLRNVDVEDKK